VGGRKPIHQKDEIRKREEKKEVASDDAGVAWRRSPGQDRRCHPSIHSILLFDEPFDRGALCYSTGLSAMFSRAGSPQERPRGGQSWGRVWKLQSSFCICMPLHLITIPTSDRELPTYTYISYPPPCPSIPNNKIAWSERLDSSARRTIRPACQHQLTILTPRAKTNIV
jgi:hypothetical protein